VFGIPYLGRSSIETPTVWPGEPKNDLHHPPRRPDIASPLLSFPRTPARGRWHRSDTLSAQPNDGRQVASSPCYPPAQQRMPMLKPVRKREKSDGAPTSRYGPILEVPARTGSRTARTCFITSTGTLLVWISKRARGVSTGGSYPQGKAPWPCHPAGFQTKVRSLMLAMPGIAGNIGVGVENSSRGGSRRKGLTGPSWRSYNFDKSRQTACRHGEPVMA